MFNLSTPIVTLINQSRILILLDIIIVLWLAQQLFWILWAETIAADHVLTVVYTASKEQLFVVNNLVAIFAAINAAAHLWDYCAR